jgi:hypothetical protein
MAIPNSLERNPEVSYLAMRLSYRDPMLLFFRRRKVMMCELTIATSVSVCLNGHRNRLYFALYKMNKTDLVRLMIILMSLKRRSGVNSGTRLRSAKIWLGERIGR